MKHTEPHNFIRQTAIDSVRALFKNLPQHHDHPHDVIRMIDREIGGLLAHPDSPSYHGYRDYATLLFPSGLEATYAGKDIILILNSEATTVMHNATKRSLSIPPSLKNPEKGVAQIIGHYLARALFIKRGEILTQLIETGSFDNQVKDLCKVITAMSENPERQSSLCAAISTTLGDHFVAEYLAQDLERLKGAICRKYPDKNCSTVRMLLEESWKNVGGKIPTLHPATSAPEDIFTPAVGVTTDYTVENNIKVKHPLDPIHAYKNLQIDDDSTRWQENLEMNNRALDILKNYHPYDPYNNILRKAFPSPISWIATVEAYLPCLFATQSASPSR